jgi:predicted SprT family Zn-dependent metalloprotease
MAKQDKKLIEALKKELKHYEVYGKAKRAEEVKKAIKAAGGKVETKTTKPKSEKKVEKKK